MDLKQPVWETQNYYDIAHVASLDTKHPGISLLIELAKKSKNILDLGCGDGTKLSAVAKGKTGTGIDISSTAICIARKKYPEHTFLEGNIEKTPFDNESFDLVYSAFVFEHTRSPEKIIKEAKRILKDNGNLVIICPNYGAPNRASPPFKGSRFKKFFSGLFVKNDLNWNKVTPIADLKKYDTDWDVTIEPYSLSLEKYLNNNGFKVIKNISTWEYELGGAKIYQKVFRFLGNLGIYPFRYWSPHIVIQAKKI
jgi:ubiquinone/menaquinone biosynthesis C-methylase UbiE